MKPTYLNIFELRFSAKNRPDATLSFKPGLNIIHGASDTGKSFSLDSINFLLGASSPLKDISERVGYEKVSGVFNSGYPYSNITIERGIDGGALTVKDHENDTLVLSEKHNAKKEDNISKYLLSLINFENSQIKTTKAGKMRGISFRDLARLILIEEGDITKTISPVLSGQYTKDTTEKSVFKLLLTGIDDSTYLVKETNNYIQLDEQILDHLILEYKSELAGTEHSISDLELQIEKLASSIAKENELINNLQKDLNTALESRKAILETKEKIEPRLIEIEALLERFLLLDRHYSNDLLRLDAIRESGILLNFLEVRDCPLCGTSPENQNHKQDCDGDIKTVIEAANAEIEKIHQLKIELAKTVEELKSEKLLKSTHLSYLSGILSEIQDKIVENISPNISTTQYSFSDLMNKKFEAIKLKDTLTKLEQLENRRSSNGKAQKQSQPKNIEPSGLPKSILGEFSRRVENLLKSWGFPQVDNVYFDETTFDFVISNKPRGSYGKGLRAITHAAFSIALLEFCVSQSLPHPGFVVLDSPLLAYKDPDPGNDEIKKTDLKDKFYSYLSSLGNKYQIIIFENVKPQSELTNFHEIYFSKNESSGRYGLFPLNL